MWYSQYGQIMVKGQIFIFRNVKPSKTISPFEISSGISNHEYSGPLQRIVTDFGADDSF